MGGDAEEEKDDMAVVGRGGERTNRKREHPSAQKTRLRGENRPDNPQPRLHCSLGSVQVILYSFLRGTHVASKLSHFLTIVEQIQQMHGKDYVHGDIRNWNMLHPFPIMDVYGEPIEKGRASKNVN